MADQERDCTIEMEEILEKLKLLNYEKEYVQRTGGKLLNRAYFSIPANPDQQFNTFKQLVEWLLALLDVKGIDFYQDPNTVSQNLLFEMKNLGVEYDFPPQKLIKGSGQFVCQIILELVNQALKKKFKFRKARQEKQVEQVKDEGGDIEGDEENDIGMNENISVASEDEVEDALGQDNIQAKQDIDEDVQIIHSNITKKQWDIECKRVANKLNINPKTDSKEWRYHIEQAKEKQQNIGNILPEAKLRLERIADNLGKVTDQIQKKEKSINGNMTDLGGEYKSKSEKLKQIMLVYNNLKTGVKEMGEQYRELSEKLEGVDAKIVDYGTNVTDNQIVIKAKTAISKMKSDINQMDLRIGVLNHTILQHKLRTKQQYDIDGQVELDQLEANEYQEAAEEMDDF